MWVVQAEEAGMGDGGMAGMAQRQAWRRGLGMAQAGGLTGRSGSCGADAAAPALASSIDGLLVVTS